MNYLLNRTTLILTVILCAVSFSATAQSAEEAYDLYQKGAKALEAKNYEEAISNLEKSLDLYQTITDLEGVDAIKASATQGLTQSYYAYGMSLYQEKEFDKALEQFIEAGKMAAANNNEDMADRAVKYQSNVYNSKAAAYFNDKNYDDAIKAADESIRLDDRNEMAYFWRGRAYDKKDDLENMKADLDKCMELAKEDEKKAKTYSNAAKIAGNAFMTAGMNSIKNKKYTEAIELLHTAVVYPDINPNAYYYLAVANNGLNKWNEAIEAASTALTMDLKEPSATYYELGRAYEGAGKTADACNAYRKVTAGQSKQAAEYQMKQVLKCE